VPPQRKDRGGRLIIVPSDQRVPEVKQSQIIEVCALTRGAVQNLCPAQNHSDLLASVAVSHRDFTAPLSFLVSTHPRWDRSTAYAGRGIGLLMKASTRSAFTLPARTATWQFSDDERGAPSPPTEPTRSASGQRCHTGPMRMRRLGRAQPVDRIGRCKAGGCSISITDTRTWILHRSIDERARQPCIQ
jgi:hypothetical protein